MSSGDPACSPLPASSSEAAAPHTGPQQHLDRVLGPGTAMMIVVGAVIGSGIFIKPQAVAAATGDNLGLMVLLWAGCGLVNLCGALTLSELAVMMPHAGGTYVYLREAYGRLWAFLWGWAEFLVIRSGSIAALAAAMVISLRTLSNQMLGYSLARWEEALIACSGIIVLATINVLGTRWGGWVQNLTTVFKAGFIAVLALVALGGILPVLLGTAPPSLEDGSAAKAAGLAFLPALGTALFAIMWTYDGWGNLGVVAEELKNPSRTIPVAMTGGVVLLIVLYVAVNLGYHLTLPASELAASKIPVGIVVGETLATGYGLPVGTGTLVLNAVLFISVFGALNANVLVGPRVLFAMARDGLFWRSFGRVHATQRTPAVAIVGLTAWSVCLIVLAELAYVADQSGWLGQSVLAPLGLGENALFDILVNYCLFGGSLFYFSAVLAVFVLRWRQPNAPRPYRTWGYPWVPALFVVSYVALLATMLASAPLECLTGLAVISLGVVIFPLFSGGFRRRDVLPADSH